jgi:hypothetical protein
MKIALIGSEGSGKTEFAEAFRDRYLDKDCSDCAKKNPTVIIDDYVEEIGEESDLAVGGGASYIGNLMVITGRIQRERKAMAEGARNLITCGTIVESSIYAVIDAVRGQSEPHWVRVTNLMNMIGSIYSDTWDYDETFVLPLAERDEDVISGQVDKHLMMAVNQFSILYTELDGTLDDKIEKAIETIKEHQAPPIVEKFSSVSSSAE